LCGSYTNDTPIPSPARFEDLVAVSDDNYCMADESTNAPGQELHHGTAAIACGQKVAYAATF